MDSYKEIKLKGSKMLFGNDILNEQGAWGKSLDALGEITLAKLEGNLERTRLTESKKTEIYGLKLDIKIKELKEELGVVVSPAVAIPLEIPTLEDMIDVVGQAEEEQPPIVVL